MRLLHTFGRLVFRIWSAIDAAGVWSATPTTETDPPRQDRQDDLFYIALLGPHI
jgi:hypothetical protein